MGGGSEVDEEVGRRRKGASERQENKKKSVGENRQGSERGIACQGI